MARFGKTEINLSDTISTLVTGVNTIADDLGNVDNLASGDSNVVASINAVRTQALLFSDSSDVITVIRNNFQNVGDVTIGKNLTVDSADIDSAVITNLHSSTITANTLTASGTITSGTLNTSAGNVKFDSAHITTLTSNSLTANSATIGSAGVSASGNITTTGIVMDGVTATDLKPLRIKNSSGTTILAGYLLSTSNTDGTL